MKTIIRNGMNNPVLREAATELAWILVNEVGVPLVKSGVKSAYKEIARRGQKRHH